jgi:RHS repeat-associated protein
VLKGRSWSTEEYRYGFNGKEKDDEFSVEDGSYDFGARMYDARLGRFMTLDCIVHAMPSTSSYAFAFNSPIVMVDYGGLKGTIYIQVMLDINGKPVIDKKTMNEVKKLIEKKMKELGVDLKVEVHYSNKTYKKSGADPSDSYIVIGPPEELNKIDNNRELGWEEQWTTDGYVEEVNGTSSCSEYFALLNSNRLSVVSAFEKYNSVADKISTVVQHESMHPKILEHPGLSDQDEKGNPVEYPKGMCQHVIGTIMDEYVGEYPAKARASYDCYMVENLRSIHGKTADARDIVEDTPQNRDKYYGKVPAPRGWAAVNSKVILLKPTRINKCNQ